MKNTMMKMVLAFALLTAAALACFGGARALDDPITDIVSSARFSPAGNAVTKVPTTDATLRGALAVRNESATYSVYVKAVSNGATAPTSTTVLDTPYKLAPGEMKVYAFTSSHDVYVMNSSAGATTSDVYVEEYRRADAMVGMGAGASVTATVSGSVAVTNAGTFAVQPGAATSGGATNYYTLDLDESEEEVKATAGQVYGFEFYNSNAAVRYVKFYNATAANVTVGTTVPVLVIALAPQSVTGFTLPVGAAFSTAVCVAATTGFADNDTGAPGANEVIGSVFYK